MATPNDIRDDKNPYAGAYFDLASYMAHPCYEIAGLEQQICSENYGLDKSLHAFLDDGSVMQYLRMNRLIAAAASSSSSAAPQTSSAPMLIPQTTEAPKAEMTEATFQQIITKRSRQLWNECRGIAGSVKDATSCYQRNVRLLSRFDVQIEGNVN